MIAWLQHSTIDAVLSCRKIWGCRMRIVCMSVYANVVSNGEYFILTGWCWWIMTKCLHTVEDAHKMQNEYKTNKMNKLNKWLPVLYGTMHGAYKIGIPNVYTECDLAWLNSLVIWNDVIQLHCGMATTHKHTQTHTNPTTQSLTSFTVHMQ